MADDDRSDEVPWHRNPNVVFTAGALGLLLIVALVITVVRMSDEWSKPEQTTVFTTPRTPEPTTSRERQPFVVTPSESTTTFTTSVPLSTTDIGVPPPAEGPTETGTTTTTTTTTAEAPDTDEDSEATTTTRKRPRFNQTRTLFPNGSRD
ncbi:hypothetical protein [[Mycobacterium] burgundiense]|uniref:Uncharacterized protein n=1 Tax=[Mycobacterium] burgundiense TaxID=3064286 RepID=A0ABM9M3B1_9MYCO|nr:hypothetical protein [Mycolicibacterium sp. MU0053]CAJ1509476.1 hypothetical protein MU0053_004196 [Mycolicibacterium sp. MU0053]